jgi:hypothetical protein
MTSGVLKSRSKPIHLNNRLRRFLRQIMADAARQRVKLWSE